MLSGLLGGPQPAARRRCFRARAAFETVDVEEVAAAAYELESTMVVTHAAALGRARGDRRRRSGVAAVLIVESRMCAVLADLAGLGDDLDALLVNDAEPLTPTEA